LETSSNLRIMDDTARLGLRAKAKAIEQLMELEYSEK
jgi:hypothetical protein